MKNLFQPEAVDEVISRIDKLQPASLRQWGKMDVAQAHNYAQHHPKCSAEQLQPEAASLFATAQYNSTASSSCFFSTYSPSVCAT